MKKITFIAIPILIISSIFVLFLSTNNKRNNEKLNNDNTQFVNNELPKTFQVKNQNMLYGFLDGFIGDKTNYSINDGGMVYLINSKYNSIYGSYYRPLEFGQNTTWLPPIGSEPKSLYSYDKFKTLLDKVQQKYPDSIVKEGNYNFIIVDLKNNNLIDYMNSQGMTIQQDMQGQYKNSSFYQNVKQDGEGWPTNILRKPIYSDQLKNYNNIDMSRDFWNNYNMMQTSVYKDSQGQKYNVTAGPNPDQFTYSNGDFSYSFENNINSSAIDQLHDWIKSNKMQLITGKEF